MNYYKEGIILNWNEDNVYEFYEWNDFDYLELVKKIPLFKVKHRTFLDILENRIVVSKEFLLSIKDKTEVGGTLSNVVAYAALFSDGKDVMAVEFDDLGLAINYSKLLLDEELTLLETVYNLKEYNLEYEIREALPIRNNLRQISQAKKLITLEINNLFQNKDKAKLKYLYYEYKKENEDNLDVIYNTILRDINSKFNEDILKLYYIIKLSYHNV